MILQDSGEGIRDRDGHIVFLVSAAVIASFLWRGEDVVEAGEGGRERGKRMRVIISH